MRKGIPPMPVLSLAASATNAGVSVPLGPDNITEVSFHGELPGDASGTLKVEVSNDPRAHPEHPDYASSLWEDETAAFGLTDPAGAAADEWSAYTAVSAGFIRLSYTHVGGTGAVYYWMVGRSGA